MSVPTAYARLMEKIAADQKAASEMAEMRRCREEENIKGLFRNLCKALTDYDGAIIEKHTITVSQEPEKNRVFFFVDGEKWLTFQVKLNYHYCRCENACNCGVDSTVSFDVIQHKKTGDRVCYFQCSDESVGNEDKFAYAISDMMGAYQWRAY